MLTASGVAAQSLAAKSYAAPSAAANASKATPAASSVAPTVYYAADEMPSFTGGAPALLKFLRAKQQYPLEAQQLNISGKVLVSFVVDEEGRLRDPQVVRGLGAGLDEEALRLVRIMPWWVPGRINGRPVRVAYTLPIVFQLLD
ncbi:energy transducer TonB [Hymenobacter sp. AT01-02]|uniref:energy transducer TonB n=1 Tax=Hymenobacter sp. AT01-02 TaxID=1571877 RepID=UPI0006978B0F|nr:energy transducer TonB [Hymenobacter sp. AT01-02]